MNSILTSLRAALVAATLAATGPALAAYAGDDAAGSNGAAGAGGYSAPERGGETTTQRGGMTLSQAVESVRRSGNVERIISAETRVSNGREVHVIKVLTRDGKVRTHRIPGRKRD